MAYDVTNRGLWRLCMYNFKRIGMNEIERIKELFTSVFTVEPWNDDWSNQEQLDLYLSDLVG